MKNFIKVRVQSLAILAASVAAFNLSAAELDENCVVNILNRTIQVAPNGGWSLPNVPSNQGAVRARATCIDDEGATTSGQSGYFNLITNGITPVGEIFFAEQEPVPSDIRFAASSQISLTALNQNYQLTVTAEYPGGIMDDVTAGLSGTNYISSNPATVTVSNNGLLTAVGSGNALITANKDGVVATRLVKVSFTGDQDGDGLPDDYETDNGLDPTDPADAFEDTDNDGLSALEEYEAGTDPNLADTDDDGIDDFEELNEGEDGFITSPLLADSDADGLSDLVELTVGSSPIDSADADYESAITSITVQPSSVLMTFNGIDSEVSTQLTVTANVLGGDQLNVTEKSNGTSYTSNDLTVVSFGLTDGEIFGGEQGQTTVTVSLFDLSVEVPVTVESFQPAGISQLQFTGNGKDTDVQGDYVYIAASSGGLHIVNTSDKENPELISTLATSGSANDVKVVGNTAYVAVDSQGLDIIDVSNPEEPALIANFDTVGSAVDLAVQNDVVFVAGGAGGLDIISVQNSAEPVRLSKLDTLGNIISVDVQNDKAVVATASSVIVIDILDVLSPMRLGSINIGNIRAVVMDGDYAYVACYTCGYKVISLTDAQQPVIVGGDTRFYPSDVELTNGFAFFSDILFVNAVPFVNIVDPENSIFQGVIDIRQFGDRDAVGLSLDAGFVYSTGSNRLYISQYRILNDSQGIAPTVEIVDPLDGEVVVENSRVIVRAEASDDVAVAAVNFSVNGELILTDTTRPYEVPITVPGDSEELNILVQAVDFGNNIGDNLALLMIEPDEDLDGLGDNEEVFTWNTDPQDADSDDDNVLDGEEIELGTNPLDSDSDNDGLSDGDELADGTDPLNPDTTAPTVTAIDPANEAIDICENQSITVTFDEALLRSSLNQAEIILSSETQASVSGIVSLMNNNTQVLFNPDSLLADNTAYAFSIANIRDEAGNLLAETFTSGFNTGNCVDEERPRVIDISPVNAATNVPVNVRVSVTFSEPVDPLTVTEDSFYMIDQSSGARVNGVIELVDDNTALQFTPNVPLLVGRRHYVYATGAILDLFENPLVGTTRYFDTAFELDGNGPQVVSTSVANGAENVPVNAQIAVLFDEAVNALFLTDIELLDAQGAPVAVTREQSADKRRVVLKPLQNLNPEENYQLLVDGVQDLSSNLLANPLTFDFATGTEADTETSGVMAWSIPRNNTLNVALNPELTVDFSERIDPTTLNLNSFYLYDTQTGLKVRGQIQVSDDAMRIEFIPDEPLRPNRRFYLYLSYSPYITDLAGNIIAQHNYRYFSTGLTVGEDADAIAVASTNILDGNTVMPVNGRIELVFAEELGGQCDIASSVMLMQGENQVAINTSLNNTRRVLTITSSENLTVETEYQLMIDGLCDFSGNTLTGYSLGFTTGADENADTVAPNIQSITPAHTATDVSVNSQVVMTFDEPVDKRSAPPVKGAGVTVPGSYLVEGNTVTFTPEIALLGSTRYTVELHNNIPDLAGNVRWLGNRYFDTQATEDNDKPTILAISPAADSTDVSPTQSIVVTFDEPMNINTLNKNNIALYANGSVIDPNISRSADGREISLSTTMPNASIVSLVMTDAVTDLSGNRLTPFVVSFTTGVLDNDNTRPSIVGQIPANGSSNWADISDVYFYVSEPVDATSLADAFHLAENGILSEVDIEVLGNGRTIKVSKAGNFVDGALVQVYWDTNALDLAGNQLHAYNGYFNMADPNDSIGIRARPDSYFPSSGTTDVPLNPVLMVRFNEALDDSSFTAESVTLTDVTNNNLDVSVSYQLDESGQVVIITPDVALEPEHQYYLWLSATILDDDGDNLAFNPATYFYTQAESVVDDRQPGIIHFSPAQNETGVGTNTLFSLEFDEQINPLSFNKAGAVNVQFETGNKRLRYNMLAPLAADTEIIEPAPAVLDLAGLAPVDTSTQFTTAGGPDLVRPNLVDTAISNNQQNIALNPIFAWTFNEAIDPVSVSSSGVYIYDAYDGQVIGSSFELSADGKKITLVPDDALLIGRQYYYYAYGLRDLSGNNASNHYRYFTTGFTADELAPEVTESTVYSGLENVPTNAKLNVRLSEPVNPLELAEVSLTDSAGEPVSVNISLSRGRTLLTIVPKQLFSANSDYHLEVAGMVDLSGNVQTQVFVADFTTASTVDLITGDVSGWSIPNNNTSNVPTNPWLQVNFSEAIDPATIDSSTFYLNDNSANVRVSGSWSLSDDRTSLRFIPDETLEENHVHYFYVGYSPYLTDWAGNRVATNRYRYFTTGSGEDAAAPVVSVTNINSGEVDIPVNAQLVVVLDEPLNHTCALSDAISLSSASGDVAINASLADANNSRRTLVISAQQDLAVDSEYTLSFDGLCDYAGNMLTQQVLSFTTSSSAVQDTTAPTLASISPAHTATEVAVDLNEIVITYSEPVDLRTAPRVTGGGITVPGSYAVAGAVVTFTPNINLQGNTRYTIELHNTTDRAGNVRWLGNRYFDTADATDADAPSVIAISPTDDSTDVSPNQAVVVSFSEAMNASSLNSNNIALYHNGSVINPNIFRSADGQQLTLSASLPANALVSVVMTDAVTDLSGNALPPFVSSFTTGVLDNDFGRPRIDRQIPSNGSRDWVGLNEITFYTSEPIDETSLVDGLVVAENGVAVDVDLTLKGDGRTLIVSKAGGFSAGVRVDFYFNSSITDTSGNALFAYNAYVLTATDPDNVGVRASLLAYYPSSSTRGLPLNPILSARFNEPLDESSLNSETVILYDVTNSNAVLGTTLSLDSTGQVILIEPSEDLVVDNQYYLWFSANILDTDGDQIRNNYATYFYTDADSALDDVSPVVTSMSPPDGETGVGINAVFAARFDEQINPLTFDYQTNQKVNVQFSENNQVVKYNNLLTLPASSEVTEILSGITDIAGNSIADASVTFMTANGPDFVRPGIIDVAYSNNQQDVPLAPIFEWIFNEPIDPVSVTDSGVYMRNQTAGENIASSWELTADGKRLTIIPDDILEEASQYYVYAYYMRDLSGNLLGNQYRYFTTGFAQDETGPVINETTVFDGQTGIPTNVKLKVRFNEMLSPLATANISLTLAGEPVAVNTSLSRSRTLLHVVPKSLLLANTEYVLAVSGIKDMSGNLQVNDLSLSFTTGDNPDFTTGNDVRWSIPVNNTQNVPLNPLLEVCFDERVDSTTIDSNSFYLQNTTANTRVAGSWSLSSDGLCLTFAPDDLLAASNRHYLYVGYSPYFTDLAGNRIAQNHYRYFDTGTAADETAPVASLASIAADATDIPVNTRAVVTFDEPLSDSCVISSNLMLETAGEAVSSAVSMSNNRRTLVLTPSQNLAVSTVYDFGADTLCDYAGNQFSGNIVSFTTSASATADTVAPSLSSITPENNATGVALDSNVVIVLDESVDLRSMPPIKAGGAQVAGSYSVVGNTITFDPTEALPAETLFTVELYNNIPDFVGNTRNLSYRRFTTATE